MKKLNKKLNELVKLSQNGNFESFINSLDPQAISNYLDLINSKKREIISSSFNRAMKIENVIYKAKKENCSLIKLSFLKDDLKEVETKRNTEIKFWENIEKKLKNKKKLTDKKRKKIIKSKTQ
jgi:hypothetical protein